jgi:hypothetical protein
LRFGREVAPWAQVSSATFSNKKKGIEYDYPEDQGLFKIL